MVHYNDNLLGFMDVAQGRIDAYIYDEGQTKLAMENGVYRRLYNTQFQG